MLVKSGRFSMSIKSTNRTQSFLRIFRCNWKVLSLAGQLLLIRYLN